MTKKTETVVFRGKASYAKIIGDPSLNYNKDGKEWKMDLELTNKGVIDEAKKLGIGDRVRQKEGYLNGNPFMTFKQAELRKDGKPNQPIKVVDIKGNRWDDKLIGNGSDVDVKFVVMDHGPGKKQGVYIRSVRVLKLVPYEKSEFEDIDENDEFYSEADALEEVEAYDELDDDLPV
jgi:hypothetical protein